MAAIDDVLPRYDVHEVHSVALRLAPEEAIARVLSTPIASDPVVRVLLRLRGLTAKGTIQDGLRRLGLRELARLDGEIVFGAAGAPWRRGGGIQPFASAGPGQVRLVTDFRSDGKRLTTETRVEAVDDDARRAFLRYWRVVGPFSALIRRRWLKQIAG
jgi:hypothetical protein